MRPWLVAGPRLRAFRWAALPRLRAPCPPRLGLLRLSDLVLLLLGPLAQSMRPRWHRLLVCRPRGRDRLYLLLQTLLRR